jgi:hypothetical protein
MNRDVLNRTPEQNTEWLDSFFLLRWLDGVNDYLPRWRISKARGLQVLWQPKGLRQEDRPIPCHPISAFDEQKVFRPRHIFLPQRGTPA